MISKRHLKRLQKKEKLKNLEKFESVCSDESSTSNVEQSDLVAMEEHEHEEVAVYERLERKIDDVRDSIIDAFKKEIELLRKQLKIVLDTVSEQNVVITQLLRKQREDGAVEILFPLTTEDSLRKMDEDIKLGSRITYIKALKRVLNPGGVVKNLHCIFGDEIIDAFNIKGIHGKKRLDRFEHFYSALLESISSDNADGTPEDLLRKSIHVNKKRLYKKQSLKKQKTARVDCGDGIYETYKIECSKTTIT